MGALAARHTIFSHFRLIPLATAAILLSCLQPALSGPLPSARPSTPTTASPVILDLHSLDLKLIMPRGFKQSALAPALWTRGEEPDQTSLTFAADSLDKPMNSMNAWYQTVSADPQSHVKAGELISAEWKTVDDVKGLLMVRETTIAWYAQHEKLWITFELTSPSHSIHDYLSTFSKMLDSARFRIHPHAF